MQILKFEFPEARILEIFTLGQVLFSILTRSRFLFYFFTGKPEWSHKKDDIHYLVRPATQEVKMDCDVRGYPTPTITWFQDGKQVKPDGHKVSGYGD